MPTRTGNKKVAVEPTVGVFDPPTLASLDHNERIQWARRRFTIQSNQFHLFNQATRNKITPHTPPVLPTAIDGVHCVGWEYVCGHKQATGATAAHGRSLHGIQAISCGPRDGGERNRREEKREKSSVHAADLQHVVDFLLELGGS